MHTIDTVAHGAVPVLLTPFTNEGSVDYIALDELVEFNIRAGVSALFTDCLSSEVFQLSDEERVELADRVTRQANGRVAVVAGGNFGDTLEQQAKHLQAVYEAGADAAVVLVSNLPQADDITGQLLRLTELTDIPLGLYECPHPTHRMLNDEQVGILADTGRYVFMKDTTASLSMCVKKQQRAAGSPLRIFQANFRFTPTTLREGGFGHCGVIANPCPELCAAYCDPAITDEVYRQQIFDRMLVLHDLMMSCCYPASAKYILQRRGLSITTMTRTNPPDAFTAEHRRKLDECIEGFEFLH